MSTWLSGRKIHRKSCPREERERDLGDNFSREKKHEKKKERQHSSTTNIGLE